MQVLVVDDDALARTVVSHYLSAAGYKVIEAASTQSAVAILSEDPQPHFDCVVSDYLMPGETGLDLLAWIQEQHPTLAALLITAAGEKDVVAEALRLGAVDFLEKPIRKDQVQQAVLKARESTRKRREAVEAQDRAKAVGRIQSRLIAGFLKEHASRIEIAHFPKFEAGGDFISIYPLDSKKFLILIADVSGHDLGAAFISAYFQGVSRGMVEKKTPVEEIVTYFNEFLCKEWDDDLLNTGHEAVSLSVCGMVIDQIHSTIDVVNAGFPAPFLITKQQPSRDCSPNASHPLGWFPNTQFSRSTLPHSGSGWIMLWTDGLLDLASDIDVDPWSLAYFLRNSNKQTRKQKILLNDAADDVLVARIRLGDCVQNDPHPLLREIHPGNHAQQIDSIQERWERSLKLALPDLSDQRLLNILIVMRETLLNGLKHGCKEQPDLECFLELSLHEEGNMKLRVDDPGPGHSFDWESQERNSASGLHDAHRGLLFINKLASKVSLSRNGASLIIDFLSEDFAI